jgi:prolyl oligopeptidase
MRNKRSTAAAILAAVPAAILAAILVALPLATAPGSEARGADAAADSNPYLWLAQIHGRRALAWVQSQNARSDLALKTNPTYVRDPSQILDMLNASRLGLGD